MCNIAHHFSGKLTIPLLVLLAIVLMVVVIAPPSYADPNFTWDRAAYWDGRYPSGWAGGGEVMRDALEFAGYKILDADQLKMWMDARITDGTPSVVVFCHCIAPDTVVESMSSRCTLRLYLDAGGKIVWYADIPMFYQGHVDGTRTNYGVNGSINILGFDAASGPWDTQDEVAFTVNGVNWGLTETWQSERPTSGGGLRVLAKDNSGYAAAWVKHYVPGDNYRGFVRLFDRHGEANPDDIMRLAEYVALRSGNPEPADGAKYVYPNVELSWSSGFGAQLHIVYFGDNFDDMNNDAGGFLHETTTYTPGTLEWDKVYYWRIDEFDGVVIHKGDIWSFRTLPEIDPNLIGWWRFAEWESAINSDNPLHWYKFDETTGTYCVDSGSAGLGGTYDGVSLAQEGYFGAGTAVRFDRSQQNRVNLTGGTDLDTSWTVEYIVKNMKPAAAYDGQALHDSDSTSVRLAGWTSLAEVGFTLYVDEDYRFTPEEGLTLEDLVISVGEWMHLTWRRDDAGGTQMFFNGKLVGTSTVSVAFPRLRIGGPGGGPYDWLDAVLDESVVFGRALTDAEIIAHAAAAGLAGFSANNPSPANGAFNEDTWVSLSWLPGYGAVSHDVYFGDNFDDVNDGTEDTFQGNQTETVFAVGVAGSPYPDGLVPGTTYYWRIDEVEADGVTIHKGDVWSFSTAPDIPTPPKGRGCFLFDTPVWVNGALVQISNVVSGQMVGKPHCDLATECLEQIETVEEHEGTFECRDIVLESGNRISVVDAHCFMLDSGQWIAAQDLISGLRLKTLSGTVGIKSVATRAAPFVGKVYNLKVTGAGRYLVSEDGVIVRDY